MSAYIDRALDQLIEDFDGDEIDVSGFYGAQSPDLIQVYVSRLLGRTWPFPYGFAKHLWEDPRDLISGAGFERVHRDGLLQRGDVLVFDGWNGTGTVGIYTGPGSMSPLTIDVFTQTPGPAGIRIMELDGPYNRLLGAWRLTAGAECKIIAADYARRHGYSPTCPPGDPSMKPGDVAIFPVIHGSEQRGHVVRVSGRGHGKTALLERLKAMFGGSK